MATCTNDCKVQRDKTRITVLMFLILALHCTEKGAYKGFLYL